MVTRVTLALAREQARLKRAGAQAVDRAVAAFAAGPDPIQAVAIVRLGLERGLISPQEGAELSVYATKYAERGLPERIVLVQALYELAGRDPAALRRAAIFDTQEANNA